MRRRCFIWLVLSLFLVALLLPVIHRHSSGFRRLSPRGLLTTDHGPRTTDPISRRTRQAVRLSNTSESLSQLARSDHAILLENALLDTTQPLDLPIPAQLRAQGKPGAYIVQSRAAPDAAFRTRLKGAGASLVAYIPNNAYLVCASSNAARQLANDPLIQAVLPYEPYYKLKGPLLDWALQQAESEQTSGAIDENPPHPGPLPAGTIQNFTEANEGNEAQTGSENAFPSDAWGSSKGEPSQKRSPALNSPFSSASFPSFPSVQMSGEIQSLHLLMFPDARSVTLTALGHLGVEVQAEEASPFGRVLSIRAPVTALPALASLPGVQELELAHARQSANDLSRVLLGISPDSASPSNYLGLTGSNVLVNVNDTGVDTNQPDIAGRVFFDVPLSGMDSNGHGTHVAGIIAGSGIKSTNVAAVAGSPQPVADLQFRGKAPAANVFSVATGLAGGGPGLDSYLQQTAAQTNTFISNNSWLYASDNQYDLAAASYDAAVRDALPGVPGSQPVLFVFAAGNSGGGNQDGTGGNPGTIQSPATAKNVITVGALELRRCISNKTWTCNATCVTNTPWLPLTDSSNQVAAFSSRGNVGVGVEGDFGRFKPDLVTPGTFVVSTRSTEWNEAAYYSNKSNLFIASPDTNAPDVLSNLNETLGPFYRFESGTSLAAADVSGTLALMQEFFEQRLGRTNSPALMKALLINGARPLTNLYNLHTRSATNSQGWGLVNLPNSLPAALTNLDSPTNSMFLFDQDPASALATGQRRTRVVSVSDSARTVPLRFTLVWTDPPGNPAAGLKLVNDLDLLITNLDTGDVFFGNDIAAGSQFNLAWDTNSTPTLDFVNNVENVYLAPPLGSNYSVTIFGHRVNVNAVTAAPVDAVQDYALVISSGDGEFPDALTLTNPPTLALSQPVVTLLTNNFSAGPLDFGALLLQERAGANAPLLSTNTVLLASPTNSTLTIGLTNQWHFYVLTNGTSFTNAAFLTFSPSTIALLPPGLAGATNLANTTRAEADLDLYVSRDPALTNLDPTAIAAADKSLSRGGTETIVYTNATPGLYYIGVKSESQQAAEYGFLALLSEQPFAETDTGGNQLLRGIPAPGLIPGGTPTQPGVCRIFAIAPDPIPVRRAIVTNILTHPAMSNLVGTLTHRRTAVVLDNHATNGPVLNRPFVFDDSGQGDIPGAQPPDGPGALRDFAGHEGRGQWMLTWLSTNQAGTNDELAIFLERQQDLTGALTVTNLPGACVEEFINLPIGASNLTASAALESGSGPLSFSICPLDLPPTNCPTLHCWPASPTATLTLNPATYPALNPGLYAIRSCNLGSDPAIVQLTATYAVDPSPPPPVQVGTTASAPIPDDAVSSSSLFVTNQADVVAVDVSVHLDHPRVSDLALFLISPSGTRVLLDENRGGLSEGLGLDTIVTNFGPVRASGGPNPQTNIVDTGRTSGALAINADFRGEPDEMTIYYEGNLLYDSGMVSNTFAVSISYGPGSSTFVTIVMNQNTNPNPNTSWTYSVAATHVQPVDLTLTENTNLTVTPIKFAATPLTNVTALPGNGAPSGGIYYLPEESLTQLVGEPAFGNWTLEIWDNRAGPTNAAPMLRNWQLAFTFARTNPLPPIITLSDGIAFANTNTGAGSATDYYRYIVATNALRAQFEINHPTANVALVAHKGLPLPSLSTYDFLSDNPAANDQLIVFYDFSTPIALTSGEWFLAAVNTSGGPVAYSIKATGSAVYGTNIVIENLFAASNRFCVTWTSLPGAHYFLQGKVNPTDTEWTTLSPTITADSMLTTYCIPLAWSYLVFRVQEGIVLTFPPPTIADINSSSNGVLLAWMTFTNCRFNVQWSPTLGPAAWHSFTDVVTSATGAFSFLDDGTQSGGLGPRRFYRLVQLP